MLKPTAMDAKANSNGAKTNRNGAKANVNMDISTQRS